MRVLIEAPWEVGVYAFMALCTAKIVPESCRTSAHEKTRYARSIPGRGGGEREVSAHKRRFGRGLSAGEKKDENLHVTDIEQPSPGEIC
jgi:hypothetical protein